MGLGSNLDFSTGFARVGAAFVFLISSLALVSCAKNSTPEENFSVSMVPSEPLVNNVAGKRFVGISNGILQFEELKDNWLQFRVNLRNGTNKTVTINALKVTIKYTDKAGQLRTAVRSFTPADFYSTKAFWLEIPPGAEVPLGLDGINNVVFYLTGLPKEEKQESFVYQLFVEPLGWFGTFANPEERFNKFEIFTTR